MLGAADRVGRQGSSQVATISLKVHLVTDDLVVGQMLATENPLHPRGWAIARGRPCA